MGRKNVSHFLTYAKRQILLDMAFLFLGLRYNFIRYNFSLNAIKSIFVVHQI